MIGLTPVEIYELELWEFNLLMESYNKKIIEKEKDIIKLAYYTASFTNAKKLKGLRHYLNEIDNPGIDKEESRRKIEFAKEMAKKIRGEDGTKSEV